MTSPFSGPRIIAVIHYLDDATTLANAVVAEQAGADGVALIHMGGQDRLLDPVAREVRLRHPEMFLALNRLSMRPDQAILADHAVGADGSWIDNPGLYSHRQEPIADDIDVALVKVRKTRPDYAFFGSVAFKTQAPDPDPAEAARLAVARGWIATTSGPATGTPPDEEKLKIMRVGAGRGGLGVASGVAPSNAHLIAPHVDWILVATGVSRDFHHFDQGALRDLVQICAGKQMQMAPAV